MNQTPAKTRKTAIENAKQKRIINQNCLISELLLKDIQNFQLLAAETFAKLGLPHSLIENEAFRNLFTGFRMIERSNWCEFASRRQHRALIVMKGREIREKILESIERGKDLVTLALDGWTGHHYGDKNTNILALYSGKSSLL